MKPVAESSSSWAHISWASYTWVSLLAWSGMADMEEDVRVALKALADVLKGTIDMLLKEARDTQEQELIHRPAAQAQQEASLESAAARLNEALALAVLRAGGGSKNHPTVREFLPELATGVTNTPIADRARRIRQAAERLAGLRVDFAEKAGQVERLRTAAAAVQAAVAANDAARDAWSGERSAEVVAKNRLRLEMERTYGHLKALLPGRRGLVESFFRRSVRLSSGEPEEGTSNESPDTAPSAAPATSAPAPAAPEPSAS